MYGERTTGLLQVSKVARSRLDLEETAGDIATLHDEATRMSNDIVRVLYGQADSVAYEVSKRGEPFNLRILSAGCPEMVFVYAYQKPGGSFIREVWHGGSVKITHSCNNNPYSILRVLMWGHDMEQIAVLKA